jgi:hypothetical protein
VAERTKAPISKIGWAQALVGSNPTPSAITKMPESPTPESAIPEEVLSGWRTEFGHQAEEKFQVTLKSMGVEVIDKKPDEEKSKKLVSEGRVAVLRASAKEDFEEGIDFHFFNPLTGKLTPVDVSVSKDPSVHVRKREKEKSSGIRFLPLNARALNLASKGSERDQTEIWHGVNTLLLEDALHQARSGKAKIPQPQVDQIERKLGELQKAA